MIDLSFGFVSGGLFVYPSADDPSTFYYVPGAPSFDLPAGRPTLRRLSSTKALLTAVAVFVPDDAAVRALQADVVKRHPDVNPDLLELDAAPPAQLTVAEMELAVIDASGARHAIATAKTSGYPPFNTVLNATLEEPLLGRARLALEERTTGVVVLTVRYALALQVRASARLTGDVGPMLESQLDDLMDGEANDLVHLVLVDEALAIGALTRTVTLSPPLAPTRDLAARTLKLAKRNAAKVVGQDLVQLIQNKPVSPYHAHIDASASLAESVRVPAQDADPRWLSASIDLGAWIAADAAQDAKGG